MTAFDYLRIFDCVLCVLIYILIFLPKYRKQGLFSIFLHTSFFVYFILLLFFTIFPVIITFDAPSINFIPFRDYLYEFGDYQRQIVLNVLLFVPFGFFLPLFIGKGWAKTFFIGLLVTLLIESAQPWVTINRICDVTDVITNTAGTLLGYWLFSFISLIFPLRDWYLNSLRGNHR